MKTAELIETLAAQAGRIAPAHAGRRVALAAAGGALASLLLMVVVAGWEPLPDIATRPWFWMKAGYAMAVATPTALLAVRLSRPVAHGRRAVIATAAVVLVMLLLGLAQVLQSAPDERLAAWRGATWTVCSWRIAALSAPIMVVLFAAIRTLAPTQPSRAGAAAGLFAGSIAAALYALHCPEAGAAFVAVWYTLGIAAAGAVGAFAGRYLLNWRASAL